MPKAKKEETLVVEIVSTKMINDGHEDKIEYTYADGSVNYHTL